eukprot:XP_014785375.1 PREDICTED: uncharacterized protein LOC106880078 isoform X1 [Octopus bimaculoides]
MAQRNIRNCVYPTKGVHHHNLPSNAASNMPTRKSCLHFWQSFYHISTRVLCVLLIVAQTLYMDYLVVQYKENNIWWCLLVPDLLAIFLFATYFIRTYHYFIFTKEGRTKPMPGMKSNKTKLKLFPWGPFAWFIYSSATALKIILIFTSVPQFKSKWQKNTLTSMSTSQAAVGFTSLIFFFMIMSNVHKSTNRKMKNFIHEVGATVPIDLLDTMDLMELLYEEEKAKHLHVNIIRLVLGIVVINLTLPILPCVVIHRGRTHTSNMFRRLVFAQKVIQIVLINLLFISVRLVLWAMFNEKFSIFILKNVLMIGILLSDIFSVYKEVHEEAKHEDKVKKYEDVIKEMIPEDVKEEIEMDDLVEAVAAVIEKDLDMDQPTVNSKKKWLYRCECLHHYFSRIFCLVVLIGQNHYIDYLLVYYQKISFWWIIFIPDWFVIILFIVYYVQTYSQFVTNIDIRKHWSNDSASNEDKTRKTNHLPWGPIAWFVYGSVTASKVIVAFHSKSYMMEWERNTIRGPSGMQLAVGLAALIYFLMLISNIHQTVDRKMKNFIHEVGATVPIDILDTMDLMELLYEVEDRRIIHEGIIKLILTIVVVNLIVPTFPCAIVYRGRTHGSNIFKRLVFAQKIVQIIMVNLLFVCVRAVLCALYGQKFSAFIIKNILVIVILLSDIFSVYKESREEKKGKKYGENGRDSGLAAVIKRTREAIGVKRDSMEKNLCKPKQKTSSV